MPGSDGGLVAWEISQLVGREGCCLLWQGNLHEVCNTYESMQLYEYTTMGNIHKVYNVKTCNYMNNAKKE